DNMPRAAGQRRTSVVSRAHASAKLPMAARAADPHLPAMRLLPGLLVCLVACAGTDPGLRTAAHTASLQAAPSSDLDRAEVTFAGSGGVTLYAQRWRPRAGEPRGVVVIHHGLADHSDRYTGFAERLVHAGYAVWALDMRGHGRSAGVRVQLDRIDELLD